MTVTAVNAPQRIVDVLAVRFNELSFTTGNAYGERVQFGAFAAACRDPQKVLVYRGHDHQHPIGRCLALWEQPDGLHATLRIRETRSATKRSPTRSTATCRSARSASSRPRSAGVATARR